MIPRIDANALLNADHPNHKVVKAAVADAATGIGFMTVHNTPLAPDFVADMIEQYRSFFKLPAIEKQRYDMARTGSNRGWGGPGSEQVDPKANPDYKQVFDIGSILPEGAPESAKGLLCYAPNLWPEAPEGFADALRDYYYKSTDFALELLCAIAGSVGEDPEYFRGQFAYPMSLVRGNFYPERPEWAGDRDFGIATHTDYGCLTLLATDGTPGLEVRKRGGGWIPVTAPIGEFVINFGEMLEFWTNGKIKATPHRVVGTDDERISIPLFFNPNHDANVAPKGRDPISAGDHLEQRYKETYLHLQEGS